MENSTLKPIRVWLTPTIPNPWKVVLVLEELQIPYEIISFRFDDIKRPPFIKLNPNGFNFLHPQKIASVQNRFNDECERQLGVLDGVLEGKQWLVGDKMTYADLSFVPWNDIFHQCVPMYVEDRFKEFPNVKAWHERMIARDSWVKLAEVRKKAMEEQDLAWTGMPRGIDSYQEYLDKIGKGEDTRAAT
ncbi:glutathione S- transferase, nitrogen catabolite repression regulator [Pestalotiopsis sp. 9143b]|nr:glutathione S- transferase, nitrogen catabolite repression regulator [Pestalotiopsis sp. 9143b]